MKEDDDKYIPQFPKKDIRISAIDVHHGCQMNIRLAFNHREDCLRASQFLTGIIAAMIADDPSNNEE